MTPSISKHNLEGPLTQTPSQGDTDTHIPLLFREMNIFSQPGVSEASTPRFLGFCSPNVTVCTSLLEQICIAIHPPLWETGFAGAGHFVRQLKKKERIFRSKLERRGPSLPLNLVERLSALLKSGILAELQLLSFLNPAKLKTKLKAYQKPTQKKRSLTKVWLLWIKAYEHDTKIIAFWIGAMSVTSMLSGLFFRAVPFFEKVTRGLW